MVAVTLSAEVKPLALPVMQQQQQPEVGGTTEVTEGAAITGVESVDDHIARLKANARQRVEREMAAAPQSKNPYLPSKEVARTIACRFFPNCTYGENCIFWHPSSVPSNGDPALTPDVNGTTEDAAYINGGYDMQQYAQQQQQQQAQAPQMMYYGFEGEYNPYAPAQMYASPPPQHSHSHSHSSHHSRSQSHGGQQQQGQSQQNGTSGNGYYGFVPYAAQNGIYGGYQQQQQQQMPYYQNGAAAAAYPGGIYMPAAGGAMIPGMEDQMQMPMQNANNVILSPSSTSSGAALMQDPAIIAQGPESSIKSPVAVAPGEIASIAMEASTSNQSSSNKSSKSANGTSSKKSKKASANSAEATANGELNGTASPSSANVLSPTSSQLQANQPEFLPQHIPYYPAGMPMQLPGMPPEMMMMMPLSPVQAQGQGQYYSYPGMHQQPYMQHPHAHAQSQSQIPMPASLEADFAKVSLAATATTNGAGGENGSSSSNANANANGQMHTFFQTSGENSVNSAPSAYTGPPANAPRAPRAMNGTALNSNSSNGTNGAAAPFVNGKFGNSTSTPAAALSASHPNGSNKRGLFPSTTNSSSSNFPSGPSSSSLAATRAYVPPSSLAHNGPNGTTAANRRGLDRSVNGNNLPTIPCRFFEMKSCRHGDYCHYTHLLLEERPLPVAAPVTTTAAKSADAAAAGNGEDKEEVVGEEAVKSMEVVMTRDARRLGLNIGAPDGSISERAPKAPVDYRKALPHHHHNHNNNAHHHNSHNNNGNHHMPGNNGVPQAPNGFGMPQVNGKGRFVHPQAPNTAAFAQHTQQQQQQQAQQQAHQQQQQQQQQQAQPSKQEISKLVNGTSTDAEKIQRLISETRNLPSSSPSATTQASAPRAVNGAAPSAPRQPNGAQHNSNNGSNIPSTLGRRPPAAHRTAGAAASSSSTANHVQQRVPSGENDFPALSSGLIAPVAPIVGRSAVSMERSASASSATAGKDKKVAADDTPASSFTAEATTAPTPVESPSKENAKAAPAPSTASAPDPASTPAPTAPASTAPAKPAFSWASAAAKAASLPTPPPKRPVSKQRPTTNGKDKDHKESKGEKAKKGEKAEKTDKSEKSDKTQAVDDKTAPTPASAPAPAVVEATTPAQAIAAEAAAAPALTA